jgi:hypothetical protein
LFNIQAQANLGAFKVHTTENRGHSPEEVAQLCVDRLISVSDTAPPAIRDQALAFREQLLRVVAHYIKMGVEQDRETVCAKLREAGFGDLADQIRRL